ncbi:MAG TPA: four helix bundle protein [Bdellovibrionales bacterium]|jgi:four helix bundle protein|nr:four helix bundle protein [Bdellovibrionales bacterium]
MSSEFRTLNIAIEFARQCRVVKAPQYLKEQLDRSSSSVALNLAEGSAKGSRLDRYRFYRIALGSFRETETTLKIIGANTGQLEETRRKLAGHITNLCKSQ